MKVIRMNENKRNHWKSVKINDIYINEWKSIKNTKIIEYIKENKFAGEILSLPLNSKFAVEFQVCRWDPRLPLSRHYMFELVLFLVCCVSVFLPLVAQKCHHNTAPTSWKCHGSGFEAYSRKTWGSIPFVLEPVCIHSFIQHHAPGSASAINSSKILCAGKGRTTLAL